MFRWLWRSQPDLVSAEWLQNHARRESRIEYHGVKIQFPIRKITNESPIWNRYRLNRKVG